MVTTIIQIPFDFEFRTTKVQWALAGARITGWARRTDATIDGSALMAEVSTAGFTHPIKYPRQNLPPGQWDNLWLEAYTDQDVERILSGWEPTLLVPSGKSYANEAEFKKHSQPDSAWQMRDEFLHMKPNCVDAKAFLDKWGRWNSAVFLELQEIVSLQFAVREALTSSAENWFGSTRSFPPVGCRTEKYPYFAFVTNMCEIAVRLTVTIDLLKQTKFKLCARTDCRQPFEVTSKRKKNYCSPDCGHLALVRRRRNNSTIEVVT